MDLKTAPQNTCPLCHEPALDLSGDTWTCKQCGCAIEYDAGTRHARITRYPAQYAGLRPHVGSEWLTRRELFERVDEARQIANQEASRGRLPLGPIAVVAVALVALCVILSAVASALVLSPTIARTRRAISAAYRPTPTATALPTATLVPTVVAVNESPLPTPQGTDTPTPPAVATAPVTLTAPVEPTVTLTPTVPVDIPPPTVSLPPTFTPPPPGLAPGDPGALPPLGSPIQVTAPVTVPQQLVAPTVTPEPSPTPSPTVPPTVGPPAPTVTPTLGAQATPGYLTVVSIRFQGDANLNEADEYVEIRNAGTTQVDLSNWVLKAFIGNQQVDSFAFDGGFIMAGGQTCRVYTNLPAGPDNCGLVDGFGRDDPLWPNTGGASARLHNAQNIEVARYTY